MAGEAMMALKFPKPSPAILERRDKQKAKEAAWRKTVATVRKRDVSCKAKQYGGCFGTLDVHHRVPRSRGGTDDLDNLILLCRLHHMLAQRHELEL